MPTALSAKAKFSRHFQRLPLFLLALVLSCTQKFIHEENIKIFKERLKAATDAQRSVLLALLAEEEAKAAKLADDVEPVRGDGGGTDF